MRSGGYSQNGLANINAGGGVGQTGGAPDMQGTDSPNDPHGILALIKSGRAPAEAIIKLLSLMAGIGAQGQQSQGQDQEQESSPIQQAFNGQPNQ